MMSKTLLAVAMLALFACAAVAQNADDARGLVR
jgi:hypothetical protein